MTTAYLATRADGYAPNLDRYLHIGDELTLTGDTGGRPRPIDFLVGRTPEAAQRLFPPTLPRPAIIWELSLPDDAITVTLTDHYSVRRAIVLREVPL